MSAPECRLTGGEFDVAAAAGWYSAIAGVLAGFALLAILIPLDHDRDDADDESMSIAVVVFTSAFFSLLILSFSYAVLAGRSAEGEGQGLAAHEQLLNGAALGISSLLLVFALRAVLSAYGANRAVFHQARSMILTVTAVVGPVVVMAFQFSNALDLERYRLSTGASTACGPGNLPVGVWINVAILLVGWAAVGAIYLLRDRIRGVQSAPAIVAKVALGFTVCVTVWTLVILPLVDVDVATHALVEHVMLAATAAGAAAVAAASWAGR